MKGVGPDFLKGDENPGSGTGSKKADEFKTRRRKEDGEG